MLVVAAAFLAKPSSVRAQLQKPSHGHDSDCCVTDLGLFLTHRDPPLKGQVSSDDSSSDVLLSNAAHATASRVKAGRVTVNAAIPTCEACWRTVFGNEEPSASQMAEMRRLARKIGHYGGAVLEAGFGKAKLIEYLNANAALALSDERRFQTLVIVGHSLDPTPGSIARGFVLTDGKPISEVELHTIALERDARLILITCRSNDLKIDSDLTIKDVEAMVRSLNSTLENVSDVTVEELLDDLRDAYVRAQTRRMTVSCVKLAAGGVATGGAAYVLREFRRDSADLPTATRPASGS